MRPTMMRAAAVAAVLVVSGAAGPRAGPEPAPGREVQVKMTEALRYDPGRLTVRQGEAVVWLNATQRVHTVTADPKRAQVPAHADVPPGATEFDSGEIPPGRRYRRVFEVPGTYRYFCVPHELAGMVGTIVVEPR